MLQYEKHIAAIEKSDLLEAYKEFGDAVRHNVTYGAKVVLTNKVKSLLADIRKIEKGIFGDDLTLNEKKMVKSHFFTTQEGQENFLTAEYVRQMLHPKYNGDDGVTTLETLRHDLKERLIALNLSEVDVDATSQKVAASVGSILHKYNDNVRFNLSHLEYPQYGETDQSYVSAALLTNIIANTQHTGDEKQLRSFVNTLQNLPMIAGMVLSENTQNIPDKKIDIAEANELSEEAGIGRAEAERVRYEPSRRVGKDNESWANWVKAGAGAALVVIPALLPEDKKKENVPDQENDRLSFGKVLKTTAVVLAPFVGLYLLSSAMNSWQMRSSNRQAGNSGQIRN